MRFFTYFLLAYIAVCAVFASDYDSIKEKVDLIHTQCQHLSTIPTNNGGGLITLSAGATIHADLQAVIDVFVSAKAEIVAFVGVLTVAEVNLILNVLVEIEILLNITIDLILGLEIGLNILGLGNECGQDLLDLNVSVTAFIDAFLGIIPSNCGSCKRKASRVTNQIQDTCTKGCEGYDTC